MEAAAELYHLTAIPWFDRW